MGIYEELAKTLGYTPDVLKRAMDMLTPQTASADASTRDAATMLGIMNGTEGLPAPTLQQPMPTLGPEIGIGGIASHQTDPSLNYQYRVRNEMPWDPRIEQQPSDFMDSTSADPVGDPYGGLIHYSDPTNTWADPIKQQFMSTGGAEGQRPELPATAQPMPQPQAAKPVTQATPTVAAKPKPTPEAKAPQKGKGGAVADAALLGLASLPYRQPQGVRQFTASGSPVSGGQFAGVTRR
jgi:hypothetical protein